MQPIVMCTSPGKPSRNPRRASWSPESTSVGWWVVAATAAFEAQAPPAPTSGRPSAWRSESPTARRGERSRDQRDQRPHSELQLVLAQSARAAASLPARPPPITIKSIINKFYHRKAE